MAISLRTCRPADQEFLFTLYASTRMQEIAPFGWPAAQQEVFLRMQFSAQQRWYESAYAQSEHQIVEQDGQPVGRLMVLRKKGPRSWWIFPCSRNIAGKALAAGCCASWSSNVRATARR